MSQTATIKSLARAFRMMKATQSDGIEWGDDYRHAGAAALKDVLEGQLANRIDRHLDERAARAAAEAAEAESEAATAAAAGASARATKCWASTGSSRSVVGYLVLGRYCTFRCMIDPSQQPHVHHSFP